MLRKKIISIVLAVVFAVAAFPLAQVYAAEFELEASQMEMGNSIYYGKSAYTGEVELIFIQENERSYSDNYSECEILLTETDKVLEALREIGLISADNVLSFEWVDELKEGMVTYMTNGYLIKDANGTYNERYSHLKRGGVWGKGYVYLFQTGGTVHTDLYLYTEDFKTAEILPFNGCGNVYGKDGMYLMHHAYEPYWWQLSYNLNDWYSGLFSRLFTNADKDEVYMGSFDDNYDLTYYEYAGNQTWNEVNIDNPDSLVDYDHEPKEQITSLKLVANIESSLTETPTASSVLVNGIPTAFEAYNIDGYNYFKLRDLASVLNGTDKQFEVGYDSGTKAVTLTTGKPYTAVGGEMTQGDNTPKPATSTASTIYLDGKELSLTVYTINDYNYFKLRDIASAMDFGVGFDNSVIVVDTSVGYTPE